MSSKEQELEEVRRRLDADKSIGQPRQELAREVEQIRRNQQGQKS